MFWYTIPVLQDPYGGKLYLERKMGTFNSIENEVHSNFTQNESNTDRRSLLKERNCIPLEQKSEKRSPAKYPAKYLQYIMSSSRPDFSTLAG